MKAMVRDAYGPPDVLELRDIDIPEIADDEVLVRVHAAGVGRDVWHVMAGLPYPIRLAGYGLRAPNNPVIGSDMAGVVEALGKNVSRFQPGDEVFGIGKGSYAEYVCAREDKLAPKPANLTFEQAAVVAIMGSTALQALRDHGKVRPGQEVLIIGASGGVGTYAVQIAKAFGARVTGVCSTQKVEMVRSIGADHVIDYTREDFAEGNQRYDVILDIGGNSSLSRSSSNPGKSHLSSTVPTRSPRSPKPCGIWKEDTPEEKSSSPSEANPKRDTKGEIYVRREQDPSTSRCGDREPEEPGAHRRVIPSRLRLARTRSRHPKLRASRAVRVHVLGGLPQRPHYRR